MSRIGVDISDLHAGRADGTTRFTYEIARRLPALAPENGWLYFSSGYPVKPLDAATGSSATRNVQLHVSSWPRFWTQSRLPFDLYRHTPDVLFMPIQQLPYLRPRHLKTVCVVHDLAWHKFGRYFTRKDWLLQHAFTAHVAREADALIVVSQATADDIARYYGRRENVYVIHHGVDHQRFRPPASDAELAEAWQKLLAWQPQLKKPYLLYVGQIQPRKNIERLIEAFELIRGWRPGGPPQRAQLVIAGTHGWLNGPIYERATKSRTAQHIFLPGRVPEGLLPALYWHADIFVMPSLYEGFGLPVLEAMACGAAVVTSDVSSLPEVAGDAAVLVDPNSAEAIAEGITSAQSRRDELRGKSVLQAAKFTWEKTAQQIASILTSV